MSRWLDRIRTGVMALALAGMLADCGGGGGGGGTTLRIFFGMNGSGNCNSVVVNVDLAAAQATLARGAGGAPDCALNPVLASNGCVATFTELDNGARLQTTIAGCTIPATTNLFSCGFDDVDLARLTDDSIAQCACALPGCDGTPPLCISDNPDPHSCENCTNGADDDGNGLTDCKDPNCEHSPSCTGSPTTTVASSTTTTVPAVPLLVNFAPTASSAPVGDLQFTVNYTSAPGQFVGSGAAVLCSSQVAGATFARDDKDSIRKLSLRLTKASGFSAPTALVSCQFLAGTPVPVSANFTVVVNSATGTNGNPVSVSIKVTVTDSSTTTTLEPVTTTTLPAVQPITVNLALTSSSAAVADLQFTVNYTSAHGEFEGSGALVECSGKVAGATFTADDKDAVRRLSLRLTKAAGFSAPTDLVSCQFLPGKPAPVAANFSIVLDSATGVNDHPVTVAIAVTLSETP